jgi:hypothetical protein
VKRKKNEEADLKTEQLNSNHVCLMNECTWHASNLSLFFTRFFSAMTIITIDKFKFSKEDLLSHLSLCSLFQLELISNSIFATVAKQKQLRNTRRFCALKNKEMEIKNSWVISDYWTLLSLSRFRVHTPAKVIFQFNLSIDARTASTEEDEWLEIISNFSAFNVLMWWNFLICKKRISFRMIVHGLLLLLRAYFFLADGLNERWMKMKARRKQ